MQLTRQQKIEFISSHIDPMKTTGIEFGPHVAPLFRKTKGYSVKYLESRTTAELRELMVQQGKNPNLVEQIDFILDRDLPLSEMVKGEKFHWAASSHVIEHIPNTVGHLRDVSSVLRPGGIYAMLIPDRNYCFDCLKPASSLGMFIEAYVYSRTTGTVRSYVDEARYGVRPAGCRTGGWTPDQATKPLALKRPDWRRMVQTVIASEGVVARDSFVHQWHFDPIMFPNIIGDLIELGLIDFDIVEAVPTYNMDFICILKKSATPDADRARQLSARVASEYRTPVYDLQIA